MNKTLNPYNTFAPIQLWKKQKNGKKLLNLALNRIIGGWDEEKLTKLIKEINEIGKDEELKLTGFDKEEIEQLLVQYELIYPKERIEIDGEEEVKKLFALNVRVPIDVEKPQVKIKEEKVAFYTENLEEWKKIRDYFKMKNKAELDTKKLLEIIK
jgi:hypothetical protein